MKNQNTPVALGLVRKITLTSGIALMLATPAWAVLESDVNDEWLDDTFATLELVKVYDQNNDKLLSGAEIQQAANSDMNRYDVNRDNQLSLAEFENLWDTELQQYTRQEFRSIDTNNSHDLSIAELVVNYKQVEKSLFAASCLVLDPAIEQEFQQEAKYEIVELDSNRDGRINYAEFSLTDRRDMVEDFRDIDLDGDGQLTMVEYQASLQDLAHAAIEVKRNLPVQC